MNDTQVLTIVTDALAVAAKIAGPLLIVSLVVGVFVSLFQAVTQVQEMSLTFVPKLVAIGLVVLFAGNWMLQTMVTWIVGLWSNMASLI